MNLRDNSIDLVSFNKLFTEYHERFVRFAYTYVDNYMEAEDIVMEAMTYYWENRTRLFGVNPPAYIFTTIIRLYQSNYKSMQHGSLRYRYLLWKHATRRNFFLKK